MPSVVSFPGDVDVVLDRNRDALKRTLPAGATACVGLVGFQQSTLGEHDPKCVQLTVEALDPAQVELDQLARGDLPGGDQLSLVGDPRER